MIIDFNSIPVTVVPNMRGGEKEVHLRKFENDLGKIMRGKLIPGASIGMHTHKDNEDVYVIVSGEGTFTDSDGKKTVVHDGDITIARPGDSHALANTGKAPLIFLNFIGKK